MNDRKICFIMCVNDKLYEEECIRYINRLNVPEGYEVEQLSVVGASSMTSGYNEAMRQSDAKYKVYLHQDVFILYKDFIRDLLQIFSNEDIGMLGMVGSPVLPEEGIMWAGPRVGMLYTSNIKEAGPAVIGPVSKPYELVEAVDGLLIATQTDIPWREDLFKGWDFYDISQSMEFRRRGYKIVVPYMEEPWCLHDDGFVNLATYFDWQEMFVKEYGELLNELREKDCAVVG